MTWKNGIGTTKAAQTAAGKKLLGKEGSMKLNANIVLAKCGSNDKLYGMRVEEYGKDWYRTWAFTIKEKLAEQEGFDKTAINGSFEETDEYPGCPYCGGSRFVVCGTCNKISCYHGEKVSICAWCGKQSAVRTVERLDVTGGDY